ncbi:DEAD helicases superfamily protein-like protein [Hyaloscypha variabilis F]|uniref:Pre-mRNA-splicing factor n=1 Tax=Hyaloscypha variabilis (strain UAMH 11265 / GT02V1 / F) TaxID=1149755 RepID=A0A2J6RY34_HYAVF|nr:DEAD helicases superfamily protein-like protein [Hyaloscypha variabilis F]
MAPRTKNKEESRRETVEERPTVADLEGESSFATLARKLWLNKKTTKIKVKHDVLKTEIWDVLEQEDFPFKSLLVLENLQILESYLWPGYSEDSSNFHVLLVVLIANVKTREHLSTWDIFSDNPAEFSTLFRRILSMTLDTSLSANIRTHLLSFIISAFQSLDSGIVRKECAPLVSISIWHNLSSEKKREHKLGQSAQLRKAWRAAAKRYDAADEPTKPRLRFERSWLFTLLLDFFNQLYNEKSKPENIKYCERFVEFLSDLQSQLPTRRYVNTLLQDLNTLPAIRMSPAFNDENNGLLRDLYALLKHYTHFSIDDHTGIQHSRTEAYERHCAILASLQRTALKHFKDKLTILALSNYGSIEKRIELEGHLESLTSDEITQLCDLLEFRTSYPASTLLVTDRKFLTEVLLSEHEKRKTFQETARDLSVLPTELTLFEPMLLRNDSYNGSQPLAIPKLNLQYLTVGDFLWRSFILHRCESFYEIRKHIEDVIKRMQPSTSPTGQTSFRGFSKMALPITKPAILEVVPSLVGDDKPSAVRSEITLDVSRLAENVRREWESLRPDDVVFLLAVQGADDPRMITNGGSTPTDAQKLGLKYVRAAEITQVLDDKGRSLRDQDGQNGHSRPRVRRLQVKLDAVAYKADMERVASGKPDIYESMNVVVRRRGRENNFKPILESIRSLTLSDVPLASWLHEVFLGYGDPAGATYTHLANRIKKIDFRDTFLDWQHLIESLPGKTVEPSDDMDGSFGPPYVLEVAPKVAEAVTTKPSKKRRRDAEPVPQIQPEAVRVFTYKPDSTGPYAIDAPKLNQVRFTPTQVDAIVSGTQPGLTVIVGPPGTGKTDVATQIINNIYHNYPDQRTLLIAHSNQALNQLFQKIVALDIDERHLLRLGHGEEELDTEANFSKHGRVESFLENRDGYLREVDRLAANFGAPGAHGSSAETAGYFNSVYVESAWTRFQELSSLPETTVETIVESFPFHHYFSNAPQPLFPAGADKETVLDVAKGCYHHVSKIFTELADVRPFEILRRDRDKANYLLTNEARIIAMTSTHAAMRRREIASLGFHYDNVIMEEAAQITEIENFIPLALQTPQHGQIPLQRVVLCGDHFQNSPVIQNLAFRQYANLEQSLFSRLVRLGVPTINLDQQGRARPSIASLYSWRYKNLGNLPIVSTSPEFQTANAGFKYDYQFIEVPDYKGRGESEPTPHFIQNLGEAEYAVAIYQYMRLLGYPASSISILATYAGQRALIKDVLSHRCAKNPLFGLPKTVTTVDKYQGEQNDYVILSLTRTSRVGYLRDIRRLTVALSRARLGLYVLGRREVFESCLELQQAFDILLKRPDKLMLVTGELWPSKRVLKDEENKSVPGESQMENVEHLGQYVYEMTNAKVQQLRAERGLPETELVAPPLGEDDEGLGIIEEDYEAIEEEMNEGFEAEEES